MIYLNLSGFPESSLAGQCNLERENCFSIVDIHLQLWQSAFFSNNYTTGDTTYASRVILITLYYIHIACNKVQDTEKIKSSNNAS